MVIVFKKTTRTFSGCLEAFLTMGRIWKLKDQCVKFNIHEPRLLYIECVPLAALKAWLCLCCRGDVHPTRCCYVQCIVSDDKNWSLLHLGSFIRRNNVVSTHDVLGQKSAMFMKWLWSWKCIIGLGRIK